MKYLKVKDENNLVRDAYSKAILNTDPEILKKHAVRTKQLEEKKRQNIEINNLRQEINDLRELIDKLINQR